MTSEVPEGSVLGPLLLTVYMNDIVTCISPRTPLFVDYCVLYRIINDRGDGESLQQDVCTVAQWCEDWVVHINLEKSVHMCFTKKDSS